MISNHCCGLNSVTRWLQIEKLQRAVLTLHNDIQSNHDEVYVAWNKTRNRMTTKKDDSFKKLLTAYVRVCTVTVEIVTTGSNTTLPDLQNEVKRLTEEEKTLCTPLIWDVETRRKTQNDNKRMLNYDQATALPAEELLKLPEHTLQTEGLAAVQRDLYQQQAAMRREAKNFSMMEDSISQLDTLWESLRAALKLKWKSEHTPVNTEKCAMLRAILERIFRGKHAQRYDQAVIDAAVAIASKSSACYGIVTNLFSCWPSKRTLRRVCDIGDDPNGISYPSLVRAAHFMEVNGFKRDDDRVGYCTTDDVHLHEAANLSTRDGKIKGMPTDANSSGQFTEDEMELLDRGDASDELKARFNKVALAKTASQWYWVSFSGRVRFPVGHFFARIEDPARVNRQAAWLLEVMKTVKAIGLKTWAILSDSHQTNIQLRRMFTLSQHAATPEAKIHVMLDLYDEKDTAQKIAKAAKDAQGGLREAPPPPPDAEPADYSVPHPLEEGDSLFFMSDPEHFLKNARNAVFSCQPSKSDPSKQRRRIAVEIKKEDGTSQWHFVSWLHYRDTFDFERRHRGKLRVAYLLSNENLNLDNWSKMKMSFVFQVSLQFAR